MFRSIVLTYWTAMRTKAPDGGRTFTELARRAQIAQCAAEAIAEVGYADASMAEIARRAGVAKSVVSYHFSDKAGLMGEVLRTALATYAKFMEPRMAVAASASDQLRAYLTGTAGYAVEPRRLHVAVIEIALNGAATRPSPRSRLTRPRPTGCPSSRRCPCRDQSPRLRTSCARGSATGSSATSTWRWWRGWCAPGSPPTWRCGNVTTLAPTSGPTPRSWCASSTSESGCDRETPPGTEAGGIS